jgi:hypothetical protein
MEEIEVPLERSQEDIHEAAHHAKENWIGRVALFSALVAVCAAIAALLAGHNSNEAMIAQIKSSDNWGYYQAKGIKHAVLQSRITLLQELGKTPPKADVDKLEAYKDDQDSITEKAKELEAESEAHLRTHEILAKAVTLFQISIAIAAISVLTRRRRFFFVSIGISLIALFFFIQSFVSH